MLLRYHVNYYTMLTVDCTLTQAYVSDGSHMLPVSITFTQNLEFTPSPDANIHN